MLALLQAQEFAKVLLPLFHQLAKCLNSSHFQVGASCPLLQTHFGSTHLVYRHESNSRTTSWAGHICARQQETSMCLCSLQKLLS
jgi:hypothetical protein